MYLIEIYVTNASLNVNHPFTYWYEEDIERYLGLNVLAAIPNEKTQKVQGLKFSESGEANRQRGGR